MELKGYELIEELFVDSSGFGQEGEAALTSSQFERALAALIDKHGALTAKVTNAGQFQVYVGLFKKASSGKVQKIGNNTYKVELPDGYAIRLHNTNVLTFQGDNVILNSGGYQTHTTKERINRYLPGYELTQKNWTWYVIESDTKNKIPFQDGMVLKAKSR